MDGWRERKGLASADLVEVKIKKYRGVGEGVNDSERVGLRCGDAFW